MATVQGALDTARLLRFLPEAVEVARNGEAIEHSLPAQQLLAMRSAFSFGRKVKIIFDEEVDRLPPLEQCLLLEVCTNASFFKIK